MQDAHYRNGLTATWGPVDRFFFIAIEKEEPHCIGIYEMDTEAQEQGQIEVAEALEGVARCVASGIWPGYHHEPVELPLPRWAIMGGRT
jgi:hypothetical protein